jgi:hypothetical protein
MNTNIKSKCNKLKLNKKKTKSKTQSINLTRFTHSNALNSTPPQFNSI